jgi:predicted glycosyltransferase
MSREGAVMGKTSVSFFPNKTLLSVDEAMIKEEMVFHSRNVEAIVDHIEKYVGSSDEPFKMDLSRSLRVRDDLIITLQNLMDEGKNVSSGKTRGDP